MNHAPVDKQKSFRHGGHKSVLNGFYLLREVAWVVRDQIESDLPVQTDAAGSSRRFEDHGVPGMRDATKSIANEVLFQVV